MSEKKPDVSKRRLLLTATTIAAGAAAGAAAVPFVASMLERKPEPFEADWRGGFYCPCHGSLFDLAGRVYKNKPAPTNMTVPPYKFLTEMGLIIGEDTKPA